MNAAASAKKQLFETMPVPKALAAMAVPTIISQLVNLVYNMADTIYIGMTGDAYKTAAVTLAFTIFMMTVSFANLFGIGGGSLMARLAGVGRSGDAKKVCAFSFYGAIGTALVYSLLIGAFLVERFFSIPGIGREIILAVERSDFPVIKAITVYVAFATMLFNLLADLMYQWVDPRVKLD